MLKSGGPFLNDRGFIPEGDVYQIIAVDLPPNYELGLAIKTRGAAATPRVAFGATDIPELGANVFVGQPPSLRFINWTAECDTRYWVWLSDGSEASLVKRPPHSSSVEFRVPGPGSYSIWIEPKGGGPTVYRLNFSVLPRGTSFQFSRVCFAYNGPAEIQVQMPAGWKFASSISSREIAPGHWEVPSETRVLDASLCYSGITIPICLHVPRALLHFGYTRENYAILWREKLKRDLPVLVEGLANKRCRILLEQEFSSFSVCDLGDLPGSGITRATLDHFMDALTICSFVASRFALQVGQTVVPTDVFFASGDAIAQSLQSDSADTLMFALPKIGNLLSEAKRLLHNSAQEISWSSNIEAPTTVHSLLCGFAIMAAELDGSGLREPCESYERFAPELFRSVVTWTKRAKAALRTLGDEEGALGEFPGAAVAVLPAVRWQNYLGSLFRRLDDNWRIVPLLSDWRDRVMDPDLDIETGLISRPGGRELTDAARRYYDSFLYLRQHRKRALNSVIIDLRRLREQPECDGLVSLLALVFLQLAYYYSERLVDVNELALALPQFPPALKRLQSLMLALGARCNDEPVTRVEECGPGFAEVSSRSEDADLERQLRRLAALKVTTSPE